MVSAEQMFQLKPSILTPAPASALTVSLLVWYFLRI